ncbi:PREDICTED: pentatricopeptide repeat-containing protein At4g21065-like [Nelumbo nucifera]|uniref:Pentatricopeptide repeat-containing protein At4g21065-like n=1 Tax=Nelumbo nucifera TaxID=4432 RepID=A0A1U7ZPP2_NELNU|nr:PREDICTED: pentatricopeptide repeat-containing protein At4g21065-like [Nelumbo nucifera]
MLSCSLNEDLTLVCCLFRLKLSSLAQFKKLSTLRSSAATTSLYNNNSRVAEQNCLALLESCNSLAKLTQIHAHLLKSGLQNNAFVLTKFASTSSHLNVIDYAASIAFSHLDSISTHHLYDAFLFNTVIRAYAQTSHAKHNAISSYSLMLHHAIPPNKFTFPFLLKACAGLLDLNLGKQVHGSVAKFGFDTDLYVQNTMVHMYACCVGGIEFARKVFDEMPKTSHVSWSAMIGGYARLGRSNNAIGLFRKMQIAGVKPDEVTMVSVLSACVDLGALELGKWLEFYIEREGVLKTVELCNALIDMFAKCGDVDEAMRVFRKMNDKTIVSWTSVIVGLAMHGRGVEAVAFFEEMKRAGVAPDDVAFIGLLSACSHAGLVEEGQRYFSSMASEYAIVPKIEHYGCMVDLLGRAGLVKQALEFIQEMPIAPNPVIWRTLIHACRVHGELELSETISRRLIGDEPTHGSNYVLLSNIYAKMFRWENKTKIREVMDKRGLRKVPGCSMIELNSEIYEFVAGDKTHSQYKEIYEMLDEMGRMVKRAGYIPVTSDVLLDIDEEDKEDALNRHSEKLAIAFALLNTLPGTPIRIVKNLRVCGDCHSATKFISKVYNREIVVRDRNRFHHFKDGSCSCKDFW